MGNKKSSETGREYTEDGIPHVRTGNLEFERKFRISLRTTTMSEHAKTQILIRYMSVARKFIIKRKRVECTYNFLRGVIILGGLLTPALITVMPQVCESGFDPWIPTLLFSLGVSLSNAAIETFGIVRIYYATLSTEGALIQEGWNFLALTGRYTKYEAHSKCWRKFMHHVNNIEAQSINRQILFETNQKQGSSGSNSKGIKRTESGGDLELIPFFEGFQSDKPEHEDRKRITVPENIKNAGFMLDF